MLVQGGSKANKQGAHLESFIENRLAQEGYQYIHPARFEASKVLNQPFYSSQFLVGRSIYDTPIKCDFILYHPEKHPQCLVIESKWQQSGGSVDEKYPFLILNIKQQSPYHTVLVLDGGGYKKGAETWIRRQVSGKLLAVFNMAEFQAWCNKGNI